MYQCNACCFYQLSVCWCQYRISGRFSGIGQRVGIFYYFRVQTVSVCDPGGMSVCENSYIRYVRNMACVDELCNCRNIIRNRFRNIYEKGKYKEDNDYELGR